MDMSFYRRAVSRREQATVRIGSMKLASYVHVNPGVGLALSEREEFVEDQGAVYARWLHDAAAPAFPDHVEIVVVPWMGVRTGGGSGASQSEVVYLIGLAGDLVGRVVDLAAMFVLIRQGLAKLEEVTRDRVRMSDGVAVLAAADAVWEATGERDLTVAFVTGLMAYAFGLDEMDLGDDGFLVGFRSETELIMVRVDSYGRTQVMPERMPLPEREAR